MSVYTVIGAGGFIGSRVAADLTASGAEVYAPAPGDDHLLNRDLGRVFYCAGLTGDYRSRPFATVEAHASLLSRLLERGRFERIVYLSSTRVYDNRPDRDGREEGPLRLDPSNPEHIYELSKALGENLVVNRSDGRGAAARLSYVFDWRPGAAGFLSQWLGEARDSRHLTIPSSPSDGRDYIHVDDAVRGLRAILDSPLNTIVNVAQGRITTNEELAGVFAKAGWRIDFERAAEPRTLRAPDASRLAALGAQARDARELVAGYLASLG